MSSPITRLTVFNKRFNRSTISVVSLTEFPPKKAGGPTATSGGRVSPGGRPDGTRDPSICSLRKICRTCNLSRYVPYRDTDERPPRLRIRDGPVSSTGERRLGRQQEFSSEKSRRLLQNLVRHQRRRRQGFARPPGERRPRLRRAQRHRDRRRILRRAVSGADPLDQREGFKLLLQRITSNGVRTILVETANRFARDLMVQETGWRLLQGLGVELIAVDSPSSFVDDTPTAVLIRQILGAVAEFDKALTVA